MDCITKLDVRKFLNTLPQNTHRQQNYYFALVAFYKFANKKYQISDIMVHVEQPEVEKTQIAYLPVADFELLRQYVTDDHEKLRDRFLLAIALFTGLSRKYISELRNYQIKKKKKIFVTTYGLRMNWDDIKFQLAVCLTICLKFTAVHQRMETRMKRCLTLTRHILAQKYHLLQKK